MSRGPVSSDHRGRRESPFQPMTHSLTNTLRQLMEDGEDIIQLARAEGGGGECEGQGRVEGGELVGQER